MKINKRKIKRYDLKNVPSIKSKHGTIAFLSARFEYASILSVRYTVNGLATMIPLKIDAWGSRKVLADFGAAKEMFGANQALHKARAPQIVDAIIDVQLQRGPRLPRFLMP